MNINLVRVISRCSRLKCCNWNLVLLMIKKQHEINLKLFSIKMKSSWVPFPTQGMRPMSSPFMLVSYWKGLGEKPPSARNPEQHTIHCTSSYLYVTQISNAAWCSKKRNANFVIFHFHVAHNILCYPPILPKHSIFGMTKEKLVETFGGQTRCSITVGSVKVGNPWLEGWW